MTSPQGRAATRSMRLATSWTAQSRRSAARRRRPGPPRSWTVRVIAVASMTADAAISTIVNPRRLAAEVVRAALMTSTP